MVSSHHLHSEHDSDHDGMMPLAVAPGWYRIATGVAVWLLHRRDDSEWVASLPVLTMVASEVQHHPWLIRPILNAPESGEWTVFDLDGIGILARQGDFEPLSEEV